MICTSCGRVTEFESDDIKQAVGSLKLPKFTLAHYSLYIYGTCSKCMWAKRRKKKS
jgi:Fur family ferric uptake transcriptional regulator